VNREKRSPEHVRQLNGVRVRSMIVDVDGGSPDDLALEQGLDLVRRAAGP